MNKPTGKYGKVEIGQKYDHLTVIEERPKYYPRYKHWHFWYCMCDCGKDTIVRDHHLLRGRAKSCGCIHKLTNKASRYWKGYGDMPAAYLATIRCRAKKKKLEFDLTSQQLWELFIKQNKKCILTDIELTFSSLVNSHDGTASLDRIDNNKGYTIDNVQWVHKDINLMKRDFLSDVFINYCYLIIKKNENKSI